MGFFTFYAFVLLRDLVLLLRDENRESSVFIKFRTAIFQRFWNSLLLIHGKNVP